MVFTHPGILTQRFHFIGQFSQYNAGSSFQGSGVFKSYQHQLLERGDNHQRTTLKWQLKAKGKEGKKRKYMEILDAQSKSRYAIKQQQWWNRPVQTAEKGLQSQSEGLTQCIQLRPTYLIEFKVTIIDNIRRNDYQSLSSGFQMVSFYFKCWPTHVI